VLTHPARRAAFQDLEVTPSAPQVITCPRDVAPFFLGRSERFTYPKLIFTKLASVGLNKYERSFFADPPTSHNSFFFCGKFPTNFSTGFRWYVNAPLPLTRLLQQTILPLRVLTPSDSSPDTPPGSSALGHPPHRWTLGR